jgi:hypothetical protein
MSYFAADEAWKQRVAQEVNRASQFRNTQEGFLRSVSSAASNPNYIRTAPFVGSLKHSYTSDQGSKTPSNSSKKSNLLKKLENIHSLTPKHIRVPRGRPAEVRGKYAGIPRVNPVLTRPSTAGSLTSRRKSVVGQSLTVKTAENKPYRRHWTSSKPEETLDVKKEDPAPADSPEAEGQADQPSDLEIKRPASASTWKTTSSQRRYILALESQLQEERKAREALEKRVELLLGEVLAN